MIWPRNRLKKVPLPYSRIRTRFGGIEEKLDAIVWRRFTIMFGPSDNYPISTAQRKQWGEFLADRGIVWEIRLRNKPNWEGWEVVEGRDCVTVRPKGSEGHIRTSHYLVPIELATKMLALGDLI